MSGVDPTSVFEGSRLTYDRDTLDEIGAPDAPYPLCRRWLDDAIAAEVDEPTAMVVSTVAAGGRPRSRTVLLRQLDLDGLDFFTNFDSDKGVELEAEPRCAALLGWLPLHRQIRVEGRAARLDDAAADAYFAGRPRGSQIGAWASPQSEVIADRAELERLVAEAEQRFDGVAVPRPPNWGGFRIVPDCVEFWQGRPSRLHDRLRYQRDPAAQSGWSRVRLAP